MAELNLSAAKPGGKHLVKKMPVRVDLTAMVDLAFLLITFFMLTTTLAKQRSMPLVMPADGPPGTVAASTTMTMVLGKDNQLLWFMGTPDKPLTTPKQIGYGKEMRTTVFETERRVTTLTGKNLMVLVKPTDHSVYANLVDALDELNIIQVQSYAIAKVLPQEVKLLQDKGIY